MTARQTLRDAALWAGAAAVITTLHVAGALWLMRQTAEAAADAGPPPSILIDMAPMPTVAEAGETQISPDMVDSAPQEAPDTDTPDEPLPDEPPPEPDPMPEEVPEAAVEPPPEVIPEASQEVAQPDDLPPPPEEVREAEVALPVPVSPRPPQRPKKPDQVAEKPEPRRKPPPPSQAATRARAEAPVADRTAGARDSASSAPTISPARWQSQLFSHLLRRKPRSVGDRGTATVAFSIDAAGNVLSVQIARSSGSARIDTAVLSMVQRASPVPAPPPGANRSISVPIKFE